MGDVKLKLWSKMLVVVTIGLVEDECEAERDEEKGEIRGLVVVKVAAPNMGEGGLSSFVVFFEELGGLFS